ncbi:MAG TPA: VanZ family protein [Pyrinomonadaceae bacterium]|nr:VanZ family protein [Pyrinomonadaceae bacterium]
MAETFLVKTDWRGRFIRYAPLFLWIGVIFFFSTAQASMSNTSRFIRPILVFFFPNAPEETLLVYHFYIRKFAHFAEYAALAFFASRAFFASSQKFLRKYWFLTSLLLVLLIASLDEINQSFIPTRTGSVWDVLLDFSGGATMLIFVYLTKIWYDAKRTR